MNSKIRGDHSGEVMSNIGTIDPIRVLSPGDELAHY